MFHISTLEPSFSCRLGLQVPRVARRFSVMTKAVATPKRTNNRATDTRLMDSNRSDDTFSALSWRKGRRGGVSDEDSHILNKIKSRRMVLQFIHLNLMLGNVIKLYNTFHIQSLRFSWLSLCQRLESIHKVSYSVQIDWHRHLLLTSHSAPSICHLQTFSPQSNLTLGLSLLLTKTFYFLAYTAIFSLFFD